MASLSSRKKLKEPLINLSTPALALSGMHRAKWGTRCGYSTQAIRDKARPPESTSPAGCGEKAASAAAPSPQPSPRGRGSDRSFSLWEKVWMRVREARSWSNHCPSPRALHLRPSRRNAGADRLIRGSSAFGSVSLILRRTGATGCKRGLLRVQSWQRPSPLSLNFCPATGRNRQL